MNGRSLLVHSSLLVKSRQIFFLLVESWEELVYVNIVGTQFRRNEYNGVEFVSFPSFYEGDINVGDSPYGACDIKKGNTVFSDCLKGDEDEPAFVHRGVLNMFLDILKNSDLEKQMENLSNQNKEQAVIFVGHIIGGAVATLATICFLDKRLKNIYPLCITFGSPLVGNNALRESIEYQDWTGRFCHVVSKHDVVPRMLLAPYESIVHWISILLQRGSIMGNGSVNFIGFEDCRKFLDNVKSFGESSPYKPFGVYMFCSTAGAACIDESRAVLEMLILTLQSIEENGIAEQNDIARELISEHNSYGDLLKHVIESGYSTRTSNSYGDLLKHVIESGYSTRTSNMSLESPIYMAIALQLEAMGFQTQGPALTSFTVQQNNSAFDALKKARELKNELDMEIENLNKELCENQSKMAEVEWYIKRVCEGDSRGSYDVFKDLAQKIDYKPDRHRITLRDFWDKIIELVKNHHLPSDFRYQNKWINAGNAYRRLMEPLDIADFYHRRQRNNESYNAGNAYRRLMEPLDIADFYHRRQRNNESYLSVKNRPLCHRVLEKWLHDKNQTRIQRGKEGRKPRTNFASLTEDSCFWARFEEASKDFMNLQQEQEQHQTINAHLKESLEMFEFDVSKMIKEKSISKEVFMENSSFMMWCKDYRKFQLKYPDWKSSFPLLESMKEENLGI